MRYRSERLGTISDMIGAATGVAALAVAIVAAVVAWEEYQSSADESRNKLSADAIAEWSRRQPPNTRPCLELMHTFNSKQWKTIVDRQEMPIGDHLDQFRACVSDLDADEIEGLFTEKNGTALSRKGSYLLAHRANDMLDADNFIATFLNENVGNAKLLKRIGDLICRDDAPIIKNLPNIPRINDSFVAMRDYIANRHKVSHDCPKER